jgi:hypothetical protein
MAWFYEIRGANDNVLETESGYETQEAAIAEGNERAAVIKTLLRGGGFGTVAAKRDSNPIGMWSKQLGFAKAQGARRKAKGLDHLQENPLFSPTILLISGLARCIRVRGMQIDVWLLNRAKLGVSKSLDSFWTKGPPGAARNHTR